MMRSLERPAWAGVVVVRVVATSFTGVGVVATSFVAAEDVLDVVSEPKRKTKLVKMKYRIFGLLHLWFESFENPNM